MENHLLVLAKEASKNAHPFLIYKLPNEKKTSILISFHNTSAPKKSSKTPRFFSKKKAGFLICTFKDNPVFMESHLCFTENETTLRFPNKKSTQKTHQHYYKHYQNILEQSKLNPSSKKTTFDILTHIKSAEKFSLENTSKKTFFQNVQQAIGAIEKKKFLKVVISRRKIISLKQTINLKKTFLKLAKRYPHAFVFFLHLPKQTNMLGASPEILLTKNTKKILKTVALASTQIHRKKSTPKWSDKEIQEQAFVVQYIIDCLKSIRLREFHLTPPSTIVSGNLCHLKSFFTIDTKKIKKRFLEDRLLQLLHPTSAICGLPKKEAMNFISKIETHERGFFGGFLGPIHQKEGSHLFVNLRSFEIFQNTLVAHAGVGITKNSNPQKEWLETHWKLNATLKTLGFH